MTSVRERRAVESSPVSEAAAARSWGWPLGWFAAVVTLAALGAYHWLIYVPHLDQPHLGTILDRLFDVGVAATVVLVGLLIGLRGLRLLRLETVFSRCEVLALAGGLGLGVMSLAVLVLGMLHLYYSFVFVLPLVALPWVFAPERRWVRDLIEQWRAAARQMLSTLRSQEPVRIESAIAVLPAGLSVVVIGLTYFFDLSLPTSWTGYDTYQYHWSVPLLLLRDHAMRGFPGWAHANLPFNTEMLNLVALSLQAPQAASMVQDTFEVLAGLLIFGVVRRHFGLTAAWLAVAAELTVPLVFMYTAESYVETALVFYGLATLVVLIAWLERPVGQPAEGARFLALAGCLLGLGFGVKYTALEYLPGVVLLVLLGVLRMARYRPDHRTRNQQLLHTLAVPAAFVGALALAFGPWLLKNWALLGNPIYPALSTVFVTPEWNAARDATLAATFARFGPHTGSTALFHLNALGLFRDPTVYGEGTAFPAGSLAIGALIALPFCWLALRQRWLTRDGQARGQTLIVAALGGTGLLAFALWTFSGALVERYAIPAVLLVTLLGGVLLGWLAARVARRAIILSVVLVSLATVVAAVQILPYMESLYAIRSPINQLEGKISEQTMLRTQLSGGISPDDWQMFDYVNGVLPHDGKLLMLGRGTGYFFTDREYVADSGGDWVPYLVSAGQTPSGMLRLLRQQGFTYIVYDAGLMRWLTNTYDNRVIAASLPTYLGFQQSQLILIAQWGEVSLYRVPAAT
ncbi:MAG TPA: glycosyltransferase family 39 protein [Ktedonobacterales bacterium]|nr:glycosyltransferase family 39 protein [Ktedonobacterales bacterium]